eukprot:5589685-Amphidinium_carterae.1
MAPNKIIEQFYHNIVTMWPALGAIFDKPVTIDGFFISDLIFALWSCNSCSYMIVCLDRSGSSCDGDLHALQSPMCYSQRIVFCPTAINNVVSGSSS